MRISVGVLLLAITQFATAADDYPVRPVRWIVPAPPGGGTDAVGRIVGAKLSELWKQQVVIDNRGGAQGGLGTALGARAAPDGYTITFAYTGPVAVNPHLYTSPGYDTLRDFAAVSRLTEQPMIMTAHPSMPFRESERARRLRKTESRQAVICLERVGAAARGRALQADGGRRHRAHPVQRRGSGGARSARRQCESDGFESDVRGAARQVRQTQGVGILGAKRIDALPDVPAAAESGFPDLASVNEWYGVIAPAATPPAIVAALNAGILRALKSPDVLQRLQALGMNAAPSTPAEFDKQIREDYALWGKVVKLSGAKAD
jgi:tripartite-type tricarboxylate transporter receptor subunit TctC